MRIVIVEDEILIREGIIRLIGRLNPTYQIVGEASNGKEGLSLILTQKPDLVITDIRMPDLDGLEMLTQVREHGCACPAIVLTAYSEFTYARQAVRLGVIEYLLKPIVMEDLIRTLRQAEQLTRQGGPESTRRLEALHSLRAVYRNSLDGVRVDHDVRAYLRAEYDVDADGLFALIVLYAPTPPSDDEHSAARELKRRLCQAYGDHARLLTLEEDRWLAVVYAAGCDLLEPLLTETLAATRFVVGYAACMGLDALRDTSHRVQEKLDFAIVTGKRFLAADVLPANGRLVAFVYPGAVENRARAALWSRDVAAVEREFAAFFRVAFNPVEPHAPQDIKEGYLRFLWALLSDAKERGYIATEALNRQTLLEKAMSAMTREALYGVRDLLLAALRTPDTAAVAPQSEMIARARAMIHEFYTVGVTLEEISEKLCVTPEYLSQQFHREMGVNYSAYIRALRINKAKELLRTTDLRIYEIANRVGYPDSKYFSRVFKSETGRMPCAYRSAP